MSQYAQVEAAMFHLLTTVSRLDMRTAQSILSGTRLRTAASFIRRIYESRNATPPERLVEAFVQANTITTVRDQVLHFGSYADADGFISSTWTRAHTQPAIRKLDASPHVLDAMTEDLSTIEAILQVQTILHASPNAFEDAASTNGRLYRDSLRPWKYVAS